MLSLAGYEGQRLIRNPWLLGAALSLVVHVIGVGAVVVAAARGISGHNNYWVDLARSGAPAPGGAALSDFDEGVTVDLADMPEVALPVSGAVAAVALPAGPGLTVATEPAVAPVTSVPVVAGKAERERRRSNLRANLAPGAGPAGRAALPAGRRANNDSAETGLEIGAGGTAAPDPAASAERVAYRSQLRRYMHQAWHANEVFARIDPMGRLGGSLFTTSVAVRFRADGSIERAELQDSSGMAALDKEAQLAVGRMPRMPPLPAAMVDEQGGWNVVCKFHLDVGMFRFAADIRRVLADKWRPSRAFASTASEEKKSIVRLSLTPDGTVIEANVVSGAGVDFLDANALAPFEKGMRLPAPPPAFMQKNGPATVFVAFLHQAGDVRVLKPREDIEEE